MDDSDKTIPPRRMNEYIAENDVTIPGKRNQKHDGRFAVGDLVMQRYKILAELGQGGMGVVYRCLDETAGIEVALKALPPELSHNTLEMEDIKENFQLVSKLVHQNIAISKNLEKNTVNGNYYLIMECCEGDDLRRWLKQKRKDGDLTLDTVLPIIQQIAEALDYAHKQKIIHRDIKPGNVMIAPNGDIKILDFGLAAQIHTSMTRVSMAYQGTSGTGPYMAPEQWRGRAQGAPADQYALGVMTYEMLAGHLPFESTDPAVLKQAVLDEMPEEITSLPKTAQDAIKRAMSKNPAERFESCSDFVAALSGKKIKAAKKVKSSNNTKNGSSFKWVAAVLLLVLLCAGGAGYYFYDKHQKELARKHQRWEEAVTKAENAFAARDWKIALGHAQEALTFNPSDQRALKIQADIAKITEEEKLNKLKKELYQLQINVTSKLKKATLDKIDRGQRFGEHIDKAKEYFNLAGTAFDKNDYPNAKQFFLDCEKECQWIIKNQPLRQDAINKINQLNRMIAEAEKYSAKEHISVLYSNVITLRNESVKLLNDAKFEQCLNKIQQADQLGNKVVSDAKEQCRLEHLRTIDSAVAKKQLNDAWRLINEAKSLFPGDHAFAEKEMKVIRLQREEEAYDNIRKAKLELKNESWKKVVDLADAALKVFPNHTEALKIRKQAEDNLIIDDDSLKQYLLRRCRNLKKTDYTQEYAAKRLMKFNFQDFSQKGYSKTAIYSLLNDAISVGASLTAIRYLVEHKNQPVENITQYTVNTPLCKAAERGNLPVIKYLLSRGASINPKYQANGFPPLHYVKDLETAKFLVENGADITWKNKAGKTLADVKPFEIAQYLISKGAQLTDSQDIYRKATYAGKLDYLKKYSAEAAQVEDLLICAIYSGNMELIKYLESLGLSYNITGKKYKDTALHAACGRKSSKEIFQYVMQKTNLQIDVSDIDGFTPLMYAISRKQMEIVQILLEKGADVKAKSKDGCSPLFYAISIDDFDLVKQLVQKGADVNSRHSSYNMPLLGYACIKNNHKIIRYLCENGADLNARTKSDLSILDLAVAQKDIPLIKLLLEFGADPLKEGARGRNAIKRATDPEIKKLLQENVKTTNNAQRIKHNNTDLQNLLWSATKNQTIRLKPGYYEINESLWFKTPVKLIGEDPARTIIRLNKRDVDIWSTTNNVPVEIHNLSFEFKNRSNLRMSANTTLIMKNCHVTGENYSLIDVQDNSRLFLINCTTGNITLARNSFLSVSGGKIVNNRSTIMPRPAVYMDYESQAIFKDVTITGYYKYGVVYSQGLTYVKMYNTKVTNSDGPAVNVGNNFYAENCTFRGDKYAVDANLGSEFFNFCKFISSEAGIRLSLKTQCYNCTYQGTGQMFDNKNAQTVQSKITFPKFSFE